MSLLLLFNQAEEGAGTSVSVDVTAGEILFVGAEITATIDNPGGDSVSVDVTPGAIVFAGSSTITASVNNPAFTAEGNGSLLLLGVGS